MRHKCTWARTPTSSWCHITRRGVAWSWPALASLPFSEFGNLALKASASIYGLALASGDPTWATCLHQTACHSATSCNYDTQVKRPTAHTRHQRMQPVPALQQHGALHLSQRGVHQGSLLDDPLMQLSPCWIGRMAHGAWLLTPCWIGRTAGCM
jgi:hypothetical protein